jgi:hypothetical protein
MCAIHTEAPFVRHLEWPIHRPAPTVRNVLRRPYVKMKSASTSYLFASRIDDGAAAIGSALMDH